MLRTGLLLALVLRNFLLEASYFSLHTRLLVGAAELSEWSVLISGTPQTMPLPPSPNP